MPQEEYSSTPQNKRVVTTLFIWPRLDVGSKIRSVAKGEFTLLTCN
jgi:hypothetical protein